MSKRLKNITVLSLSVLITLSTGGLQAGSLVEPGSDQIFKMIPAESLFCVRVNHFEYSLNQVDQFLAGALPIPMGVSILARTQLAGVLGNPQLNGINMNGSFTVFGVILPGESTQTTPVSNLFVGGLIPITDYKQFLSSNPNCGQPDEKGISKITNNGNTMMLITQANNHALVCWANDYEKMLAYKNLMGIASSKSAQVASLANVLDVAEGSKAITDPVWVYGNMQKASKTFGPLVFGKIEEIKTNIKNITANNPNASPMMNIEQVAQMYITIIETLMKETKFLSLTINPKPTALNLKLGFSAMPETDMANMFAADSSADKQNHLLGYLEDGAMMNFGFKANTPFMKKFNDKRFDLLEIMSGQSITAEEKTKMKTLSNDITDSLGGPAAFTFTIDTENKPPFVFKYIIEVKDTGKFNNNIETAIKMMTGNVQNIYRSMGMEMNFEVTRNTGNYKGVSIDSAKLTIKSTESDSPQGPMMNAMFGDGFDYRWGIVNGLWVCAVSKEADSEVRKMIDQVKTGKKQPLGIEMKTALELLPGAEKADFVGTYNYLRLLKMVGAIMPMPIPISQMDISTKSNIIIAGKADNGKMVVEVTLPKEHLIEIIKAFQTMKQLPKNAEESAPL